MPGETDLKKLLNSLSPSLCDDEFVFCTMQNAPYGDYPELKPLAMFAESEGLSMIVPRNRADGHGIPYDSVFRCITLRVFSGLEVVGLTAAITSRLAEHGIAANVVAAYHHDHIFVPADRAIKAMNILSAIQKDHYL